MKIRNHKDFCRALNKHLDKKRRQLAKAEALAERFTAEGNARMAARWQGNANILLVQVHNNQLELERQLVQFELTRMGDTK